MDQSYIVRIYRKSCLTVTTPSAFEMMGIIEDVEQGRSSTFHNIDELWHFMALSESIDNQLDQTEN